MAADHGADDTLARLWREGARAFAELAAAGARGSGETTASGEGAARRVEELWQAWLRFLEAMAAAGADRAAGQGADPGAAPFDPAGWLGAPGLGGMGDLWRWLEGPDFADLFAEQRRLIRESGEFLRFQAALAQYRAVMAQAWLAAFRAFADRLAADDLDTAPVDGEGEGAARRTVVDRVVALWRETADVEVARVQVSEAYVAAQRDLASAQLALRASLRKRAEPVAEALGLPTRAEVDDLARTVHALRREIRALRRAMPPDAPSAERGEGP
ncbi:MAG: poly(R)-hydroxyalkanoic acid synthase subunit PhaE [Pseudomonadota bacterium]